MTEFLYNEILIPYYEKCSHYYEILSCNHGKVSSYYGQEVNMRNKPELLSFSLL